MNPNFRVQFVFCLWTSLVSLLVSCAPAPTAIPFFSTSTAPPQPTEAEPETTDNESPLFQAGLNYSDASEDMPVSFLDVVAFQAAVYEESETLEVVLRMRDIPPTALLGQTKNFVEYAWTVYIYLDPATSSLTDIQEDYYFGVNTSPTDTGASGNADNPVPLPGVPKTVPIHQILQNTGVYNSFGVSRINLDAVADPHTDTLTLRGRVPKIKSNSVFSFTTSYYDGATDRPDNYVPLMPADFSTPLPGTTVPVSDDPMQLKPVGNVRAYPGPVHYAGDMLTFEILHDGSFGDEIVPISMTLDDGEPTEISATASWIGLLLPLAFDTTNLSGRHTLRFSNSDGRLNETYSFEVLPADQRPANEQNAAWHTYETTCCVMHYIAGTAAARDIEFIAEHFQQSATDFSTITGSNIDPKLNVYMIDSMWGNGGFGGNGELVISYFDRYYGPIVGGEGLESLARHEFTHAVDIGLAMIGDGVAFNYEGLAVYVAGGHYKPEPLAERGAALYDLGHYVPVGQFFSQHELAYLYSAAMLTYIVETYGSEKMWQFLASDDNPEDDQPGSLEAALQTVFGVSQNDFDQAFQAWLERHEPGEQLEDLRLTMELQDLRREYQETYVPPPDFLLTQAANAVARPEYLPIVMREANAPVNVAIELIIANAQRAIVAGAYSEAEGLIKSIKEVVSTGTFEDPLANEYLDIVVTAADAGYEVLTLNIQNDYATAQVTKEPPMTTILELRNVNGTWQVEP